MSEPLKVVKKIDRAYRIVPVGINGHFAKIDNDDYEIVSKYSWFLSWKGYAYTEIASRKEGVRKRRTFRMHRFIINPKEDEIIDHINRDKLDNRKDNLRICTNSENLFNSKINKNNKSGYRGVSWNKLTKKWHASLQVDGVSYHLGFFENPERASSAYKKKAEELRKDFISI